MKPDAKRLYRAIEATWPPCKAVNAGPWTLREGAGGGKRVSAATARAAFDTDIDLPAAEDAMRILGQDPLFMIRDGEHALDAALAARGYQMIDPVNMYVIQTHELTDLPIPKVMAFTIWEPLAIMRDLWAEAGIGPDRLRVMERAKGPKTGVLGRIDDSPGGTAFCAIDDDVAMIHALEIREAHRRKGLAGWMIRAAAVWAADWGTEWLSVVCTRQNKGANLLYASLGMELAGSYHYRILPREEGGTP